MYSFEIGRVPLLTQLPRRHLLGNRQRIFMRGCIKVPAPKGATGAKGHLAPVLLDKDSPW